MKIRTATRADDSALVALDRAIWSPRATPTPAPPPGAAFFTDRRSPDEVLVAEEDARIVGYAILQRPSPLPAHAHALLLNGLAVEPAAQGHGVGRRLLKRAKAEAVRRGASKLGLRVLGGNTGARRLYASCGFVVEGVLRAEFVLDGEPVDDVLMAWFPPA